MVRTLLRFLVLPKWAAEALSLFNLHTYGWELRDVTTYLGIESPQHRCGKSTLLALIRRLVQRPEVAAHISSPAVFRTIQRRKPTFIVDECEKVLRRNQMLTGILNASYVRDLAYVVRVVPRSKSKNGKPAAPEYTPLDALEPDAPDGPDGAHDLGDDVARYSCWCPKAMAQVGHFPETLADRCIIITMQRKTPAEKTERLRALKRPEAAAIHRLCEEFVQQHRDAIANAQPAIPEGLNDRAADIWEPLFVLADLAGGDWPQKARQAALTLSGVEQTTNVMGGLLIDCLLILTNLEIDRIFSRDLVQALNLLNGRPWRALTKGKPIDEYWLGRQLRPFGIHSQSIWVGKNSAKGYLKEDILEPARRYVSKADWEAYQDAYLVTDPPPELPGPPAQQPPDSKT
jgi:putative DNA primase/helicase